MEQALLQFCTPCSQHFQKESSTFIIYFPPGWLVSSATSWEASKTFLWNREIFLYSQAHSPVDVMLNVNSWVIEESFFNNRLISASRIGLHRIMKLLSSQVVFIYMQKKKKSFCFFQILRFEIKKLPVTVLTGSISLIPFLSSVLCLRFYNLANILVPNPWSRAG